MSEEMSVITVGELIRQLQGHENHEVWIHAGGNATRPLPADHQPMVYDGSSCHPPQVTLGFLPISQLSMSRSAPR